ncbi:MAG: prepilin peptidase [Bryobacteraceae bacterium]
MDAVLAGLLGLLIGSFLNVCIFRLPRDLSVVYPRSYCPECEEGIRWYDNIPVFSYVLLGGRCRHCKERIPLRYPLVELTTAFLFFSFAGTFGLTLEAGKYFLFSALMIGLVAADIEERILPDEFTLGGWVAGLILAWFLPLQGDLVGLLLSLSGHEWTPQKISLAECVVGSVGPASAMWMCGLLYQAIRRREGLGFGDVKMIGCIGAFVGLRLSMLIFFLGSVTGAVLGIAFILLRRKDMTSYELPFGSFLGAAAVLVVMSEAGVFTWYAALLR